MEENQAFNHDRCVQRQRVLRPSTSVSTSAESCTKLTAAERSKKYRQSLKKNPKKWSQYKQTERERKRRSLRNRTEEQINEDKRKSRERQKRFRDKRKMLGIVTEKKNEKKKKVLTRSEREKQREYWRRKQSECRKKRTCQKNRRSKEKDRHYRQDRRSENGKRTTSRKKKFPKDPEKFVNAIEELVDNATPQKRELLKKRKLINTPKSRKKLMFFSHSCQVLEKQNIRNENVKQKIQRNLCFLKKYRMSSTLAKFMGVSKSFVSKKSSNQQIQKKQRKINATSLHNKRAIEDFFNRCDVSTNLPTAKRIKKDSNERRVLDRPLAEVYKQFKEKNPDVQASFATFVRCKPNNVQSTRKQPWFGCLCENCTNVELKLKALAQVASRYDSNVKVKDKYEAVAITLCQKEEGATYHKLQCVQRECRSCGTDGIVRFYQPLAEKSSMATIVYSKWERVKKFYKGKEVTQMMPVSHTESVTEVVLKLSEELKPFAEHLFVAAWQQNQFHKLQKNVPYSWVVLNMDFAENYSCVAQKEVQSAHWSHNQVTVHPTVAYYRCPEEGCEDIVTEHLVFVSEDKIHDASAVQEFVKLANKHLIQERGINIEKEIQLTDGCAAQYKSKIPFTDISFSQADFGIAMERHFYGSRHGKGPSDGAGAVVKSVVRRAVMGGDVVVNNAEDFFEVAKQKLTKEDSNHKEHFKRTLFLVKDIDRNRPERSDQCCKTLKGTRKVQAVQAVDKMIINTRNLSCFCEGCIKDGVQGCHNSTYVHDWKLNDIQKVQRGVQGKRGRARAAPRGRVRRGGVQGELRRGGTQRGQGRGGIRRGERRGGTGRGHGRGGIQRCGKRKRTGDSSSSSELDSSISEILSISDNDKQSDSGSDSDQSKENEVEKADNQFTQIDDIVCSVPKTNALAGVTKKRGGVRTRGGVRARGGIRRGERRGGTGRGHCRGGIQRCGKRKRTGDSNSSSELDSSISEIHSISHNDKQSDSGSDSDQSKGNEVDTADNQITQIDDISCSVTKTNASAGVAKKRGGVRTRGGLRTRGGIRTRGRVMTRGGKASIQPIASTSQSAYDHLLSDIDAGNHSTSDHLLSDIDTDFTEQTELKLDENTIMEHSFEFDEENNFQAIDISDILEIITQNIICESVQSPSSEIKQPPRAKTEQSPSPKKEQPVSGHIKQAPSADSKQSSSAQTEQPVDYTEQQFCDQAEQPPVAETKQQVNDQTTQQFSQQTKQRPCDQTEQPPSADFVQPLSFETAQPFIDMSKPPTYGQTEQPCGDEDHLMSSETKQPATDHTEQSASDVIRQIPCDQSIKPSSDQAEQPYGEEAQLLSSETKQPATDQTEQSASDVVRQIPCDQSIKPSSDQAEQPYGDEAQLLSSETKQPATDHTEQSASDVIRQIPCDQSIKPSSDQAEQPYGEEAQLLSSETKQPATDQTEQSASDVIRQIPCDQSIKPSSDQAEQPYGEEAQLQSRYHSGDFLLIKHGRSFLPGVVDEWPWVSYFSKRKSVWFLNDTKYTVLPTDIVKQLEVPEICVAGSRLYYKFKLDEMK